MKKSEKAKVTWFEDACGYIVKCIDDKVSAEEQLLNLQHDIIGLQREEKYFSPCLGGYRGYWKG